MNSENQIENTENTENNHNQEYERVTLGSGINFGVDYLGYKGNISTTHANYIISINSNDSQQISTLDIIRIGRVAANTNKQGIIMNENGVGIKITWKMRQKFIPQQE